MMRFWPRRRARRLDDFADALRPELSEIPTPSAKEALFARIVASRAAGVRVILPHADAPRTSVAARYAIATIAAAIIIGVVSRFAPPDGNATDMASPGSFWFASVAAAQPTVAPIAPVRVTTPDRLHAFSARYLRTVRAGRDGNASNAYTDVRVERDSGGAVAAWRIVSSRADVAGAHLSVDSVRIAADDLRMLSVVARQTPYQSFARIRVAQQLDGSHLTGDMTAERATGPSARRTFDRRLSPQFAPYISDAIAPIYMMGLQIGPGWRGRLSVLGWAVRDDDISIPLDLRVDGEETVHVPAGQYDCWRIAIDVGGERQWYWVRKSDGLGVKSVAGGGRGGESREIVLLSEQRL